MKNVQLISLITIMFCFLFFTVSVSGVVYVNINATGVNNGNSWADAYTTIQAGIDDSDVANEEVWVAKATYYEAIVMKSGVKLYGGFIGTETDRNQRNWVINVTTIDASTARGGLPAYHVVIMESIIPNSTIDGFTITGGNANGGGTNNYGGGISCSYSSSFITNNTISGNSADSYGGGISCYSNSSPSITNNTVSGNSANSDGGGISCYSNSSPRITNNTVSGNSANSGNGGGISCYSNSSPRITNNIISGNSANNYGGGIFCDTSSPEITNNTISGNSALIYGGGGISCYSNSSPSITNNTISGNSADWYGGGIDCWDNSSPQITNNTISGNSTDYGGGINCSYSSPAITNNSISGNSVNYDGGGIYCASSSPAITNNTISGNSADDGGGIYCASSSPAITNNTISGNSATSYSGGIWCSYSSPHIKNNIFYNNNNFDIYEADSSSDPMVRYNDFYGNPDGVYYNEGTTPYTSVAAMDSAIAECSNNIGLNPLFVGDTLSEGSWTAAPVYNSTTFQTTLTDSSAVWTENEHAGRLLNPDTTQNKQFVIVSNTLTTINVWGDVTSIAHSGDNYKIFDYHLQLASPCIDAGYDQDVPNIDFDGEPRPIDVLDIDNNGPLEEYDIGADEYNPEVYVIGVVYVNINATGATNGNSWATAYTTIQAGIDDADVSDEEVWVAQGTYLEAIVMKSGVKLYGGFNGTETELNQRNWITNVTTIDASTARSGLPANHVVIMDDITSTTIDGFRITGGNANGSTDQDDQGGGIYCYNLNDTNLITNNTITGNSANLWGGGISCYNYSSPEITNNIISGNSANNHGGGIYCDWNSSPQINKNTISGNSTNGNGGGISCRDNSSPFITNNTISGNSANSIGGGIYCYYSSPAITNNTISGNSAIYTYGYGGGIICFYSSPAITNNTISGNLASSYGGGIFCKYSSSPQIRNTIFYNNNKYDIYEYDTSSDPIVSYNDFYGNPDGIYYDEGTTPYTSVSDMDSAIAECSNNIGLNPLFVSDTLIGGNWTVDAIYNSATFQATLTNSSSAWTENQHAGRLLNPDTTQNLQFVIVSNTAMTITVWGDVTTIAHSGDTYKIFDYHLQNLYDGYTADSPCIDAGDPADDYSNEPEPNGNRINQGNYGNTTEAARSVPNPQGPPSTPTGLITIGGANSILLLWNPNLESDIAGYNVYRDDSPTGTFTNKLNSVPVSGTSYTDNSVIVGQTYYYKITAVDEDSQESPKTDWVSGTIGDIKVTMPDYRGPAGAYVYLKINCEYATGITGNGMDIRITYNKNILTPIEVQKTVLTQDFTFVDNIPIADGQINISGVSALGATINGEGHLLNIKFQVSPTAELLTTGTHTFVLVKMYDVALQPLTVDYSDTATFTVAQDYILGDVNGDGVIDSADALMALQAALGQRTLSDVEFYAADINGDGKIDSADVTLILRLAIGLPINPSSGGGSIYSKAESETYNVFIPNALGLPLEVVNIPINVSIKLGIAGTQLSVNYTPSVLFLQGVTRGSSTGDFVLDYSSTPGVVKISMAKATAMGSGSGELAILQFKVIGNIVETSPLNISECKLSGQYGEDLSWTNTVTKTNGTFTVYASTAVKQWSLYE